jgi:glycerophosphoryl diester phosphodiesterase
MVSLIAHRGASSDHPENTLDSFRGAATQGADWVELDVRPTADGEIVVIHDAHLPSGQAVSELPRASLPTSVPTLEEALAASAPMGVNVEIKHFPVEPGFSEDRILVDRVLEVCRGVDVDVLITSFDFAAIERSRQLDPTIPTGYLVLGGDDPAGAVERAAEGGHRALNPWDPSVDAALVDRCASLGLDVNVWTVDDSVRIAELAAMGVDGIITNAPALARIALGGA